MAVTVDATGTNQTSGTGVTTFTYTGITVGSGANVGLALACTFSAPSVLPASITATWDSGGTNQAMSLRVSVNGGGASDVAAIFALVAPTPGLKNLVISWTNAATLSCCAISFNGVLQTSTAAAFTNTNSSNATGTTRNLSITTSAPNADQVIGCIVSTSQTLSAPTGTTLFINNAFGSTTTGGGADYVQSTGASQILTWTLSGALASAFCGLEVLPVASALGGFEAQIPTLPNPRSLTSRRASMLAMGELLIEGPLRRFLTTPDIRSPDTLSLKAQPTLNKRAGGLRQRTTFGFFINPLPMTGWEVQPVQPPNPFIMANRKEGGIEGISQFAAFNLLAAGFEVRPPDPLTTSPVWNKRFAAIARGDDGIENITIPPVVVVYNMGFEGIWPQPPARAGVRASGAIARGQEGTQYPLVNFYPTGFEVQSVQPPSNALLNARRFGAIAVGDPGIESPFIQWLNGGWEVQSFQPPYYGLNNLSLNNRRAAALAIGDPLIEGPLIKWINGGWEVQPVQPPQPGRFINRHGAMFADGDRIEGQQVNWYNMGFEAQWWAQTLPKPFRAGAFEPMGDEGIENVTAPPIQVINWGYEVQSVQPPYPAALRRAFPMPVSNVETVYQNWLNAGWEVQSFQPPNPGLGNLSLNNRRAAATMIGDPGNQSPITFYAFGFAYVPAHQPQHPRPERSGALAKGDDGTEPQYVVWINGGSQVQAFQPPHPRPERGGSIMPQVNIESVFQTFYPSGFDLQAFQPPHPRPERAGAIEIGDIGIEAVFVAVAPQVVNWGFDGVWPQPPARAGVRASGSIARGDEGIEFPLINFYPTGFEVQSVQPPHPRPERAGAVEVGEAGIEATFVAVAPQIVNWGFDGVWPQPPARLFTRSGAIARWEDGSEYPLINFYPAGFEVQSVQPPHRRPERGSGAIARIEDGIVFPMPTPVQVVNWGFDLQPYQPQHQRPERSAGLVGGDQGTQATFSAFYPYGWPIQPPQPPHPRPERSGCLIGGDPGTEAVQITWLFAGWEVQPPQPPHPRPERAGAIMRGDDGVENVFTFITPQVVNWGFDGVWPQPPHPRWEKFATLVGGDPGDAYTLVIWINGGSQVQSFQPPHPRPEKFATLIGGDPGIEGIYVNWVNQGWPVQPPQPPHPRPERSGSIAKGDDGEEYLFFPVTPQIVNWGWEGIVPPPPHPRPERSGSVAKGDDGIAGTYQAWRNSGWEVLPVQPPHPRRERSGSVAKGDEGTEGTYQVWRNGGWEVQPVQPPHPRRERSGSVARWEDGDEAVYVFIPPGFVTWGYEPPPVIVRVRYERAGSLMRGDEGIEGRYQRWINAGWSQTDSQARVMRLERGKAAMMRGDDGSEQPFIRWFNRGGEVQPPQPPHPRREKAGSLMRGDDGITAKFTFIPTLLFNWCAQADITYRRVVHPAGAIMPWDDSYFLRVSPPVFYARSIISFGSGQTVITPATAKTVVKSGTAQTDVKGETTGM